MRCWSISLKLPSLRLRCAWMMLSVDYRTFFSQASEVQRLGFFKAPIRGAIFL